MLNCLRRNIMFLFFNGCSYTKGHGCDNIKEDRFSTLVSKHYSADHVNISREGFSNDMIVESTMRWLKDNTCDYGIILLTHCARIKLRTNMLPGGHHDKKENELKKMFYDNFYDDTVGSLNFYKNRYILEQAFEKRGIPLLLLQYLPIPWQGTNIWKEMCRGELPLVSKTIETSTKVKTILGRIKNKKFYWSNKDKKSIGHFNSMGHLEVSKFIISQIDTH